MGDLGDFWSDYLLACVAFDSMEGLREHDDEDGDVGPGGEVGCCGFGAHGGDLVRGRASSAEVVQEVGDEMGSEGYDGDDEVRSDGSGSGEVGSDGEAFQKVGWLAPGACEDKTPFIFSDRCFWHAESPIDTYKAETDLSWVTPGRAEESDESDGFYSIFPWKGD